MITGGRGARIALLGALLLAACADAAETPAAGPTSRTAPSTPPAASSTPPPSRTPPPPTSPPTVTPTPTPTAWQVGATPLPLRPDGFGEVLPTPPELVDRRLPTRDLLPPPPDGRYRGTIASIDAAVRARMGETWQEGCPVALADLRYLTVGFWGFDGRPHTGDLVVNASVAEDVTEVFRRLFDARFPLEEVRVLTTADLQAPPTGDGNTTAAFVCRVTRQSTTWSAHAYGLAVDVNPFHNPYERDGLVLPELASAYLDRADVRPGMVLPGDVVDQAFADIGWSWGGRFQRLKDYQHFSATGR